MMPTKNHPSAPPAETPAGASQAERLSRREAILRVSALLGGVALIGQSAMLAGCADERQDSDAARSDDAPSAGLFSRGDVALLDEIADTILPETDTPGAKAAGVGPFVALMVNDCYYPDEQKIFVDGLADLESRSREAHGGGFMSVGTADRLELLEALDREQHAYMQSRGPDDPPHYFRMMKELALLGYFTSEIGYRQAMRYVETPGRYDPCVPYTPGERAWARHDD